MIQKTNFTFSKFIKSIDFFSRPFNFKVNNKQTIQSFLGGVFTLVMISILLFFAYIFGNDIFYKKKPNIIMLNDFLDYFTKINFTHNNTLIAFRLEDEFGFPVEDYNNYINISLKYGSNYIGNDGGYILSEKNIGFSPCENNSTFGHLFKRNIASHYLCLQNYNLEIGGYWGSSDVVNYIKIKVDICGNSKLKNNSCKIYEKSNNYYFNIYISDANVGLMDNDNSLNYKLNNFYSVIDPSIYKFLELQYSMVDVVTDSGFFFKSVDNSSGLFLDIVNSDFSTNDKTTVIEYNFYLSNKKQTILRSYIKLQDIGAQIGGVTQILILIFTLLIGPLQEKKLTHDRLTIYLNFLNPKFLLKLISTIFIRFVIV